MVNMIVGGANDVVTMRKHLDALKSGQLSDEAICASLEDVECMCELTHNANGKMVSSMRWRW